MFDERCAGRSGTALRLSLMLLLLAGSSGSARADGLSLKARPLRDAVPVGSPVILELTIQNTSPQKASLDYSYPGAITFMLRQSPAVEGEEVVYPPGFHEHRQVILAPGETYTEYAVLFWSLPPRRQTPPVFTKAGDMSVVAALELKTREELTAEPVVLKVTPQEEGPSAVDVFSKLKEGEREAAAAFFCLSFTKPACMKSPVYEEFPPRALGTLVTIRRDCRDPISKYLATQALAAYHGSMLGAVCAESRDWPRLKLTELESFRVLKELTREDPPVEYVPIVARERELNRALLLLASGECEKSKRVIESLSDGEHKDWVSVDAQSWLPIWDDLVARSRGKSAPNAPPAPPGPQQEFQQKEHEGNK